MVEKEKIVLIGDGGHARLVLDILDRIDLYKVVGVTTDKITFKDNFCGYPILGNDNVLSGLISKGIRKAVLGLGGFRDNKLRRSVYKRVKDIGFEIISVVHPSAVISKSVILGEANVIFPGVIINNDVCIGDNVILATGSTIDHETVIGDHVLVSAGVTVGACVKIAEGALLALGSKVTSGIKIGKDSLVAAGAVVVEDVEDGSRVFGVPARPKH